MILEGGRPAVDICTIVSDEVFMACFGYRPYKRGLLTALDTGERSSHKNNNMIIKSGSMRQGDHFSQTKKNRRNR